MMRLFTILLLMFGAVTASAQSVQQSISLGNKLYKQKQFEKAAEQYQKAAQSDSNVNAQYNLGDAFYRAQKWEQAQQAFDLAASNAKNDDMRSSSFYNKGVSLSQQKKLLESIDAYKNALRLKPGDTDARENLQKALNELKKQQQKSSSSKQDNKNDQDQKEDQKNPQQNKSKLNQKQAEQMLNALRQEEKAIQKDAQKNKNRSGNVPEKDW